MTNDKSKKISRLEFLKLSGTSFVSLVLAACGLRPEKTVTPGPTGTASPLPTGTPTPTPSPAPICKNPLDLAPIPALQGERYSAEVPDTLDLQPRAELVLQTMTTCTDPDDNYAQYENMYIAVNPPRLRNTCSVIGKYFEATALLRYMTGNTTDQHVDQAWRRYYLEIFHLNEWWGTDHGRMLAWLGNNYQIEGDPCWLDLCKQRVEHAMQDVVHRDNYCYLPDVQGGMPTGWNATWAGWALQGLTKMYRVTQLPEALELAGKLARYLKDHAMIFDSQGRFTARHSSDQGPARHFHHPGNALEGIADYAAAAGDRELAAFARTSYEWARATGSPLVGFFPEYINDWPDDRPYVDCEACCTADMIQIAMTLTEAQQGDYWDDVDRYLRNQFVEMQLLEGEWIDRLAATSPPMALEPNDDADRVSEKLIGSFASWAGANDWYIGDMQGTTFCCIGNAGRTLYYVWERMIAFENHTLTLHLLLNRASPWADVDSYIPYEGRVDLKMKTACDLEVRIPEWVKHSEVSAVVNEKTRPLAFQGRYALIGPVNAQDIVTVTFPIFERAVETTIGEVPFSLIIKGNEVVSIDPPGTWYPFYQRAKYRENQAHWVTRERFVPAG
jgi:hypothetical protein